MSDIDAGMNLSHRPVPATIAHVMKFVVVAMAGILAFESLMPTSEAISVNNIDKIVHAAAYFALAFCIGAGWRNSSLWFVFIVAASFGAFLEAGQGLMDLGRTASLADQIANTLGAGLACCLWAISTRIYRRYRTESRDTPKN